jgi:hypothetical protein
MQLVKAKSVASNEALTEQALGEHLDEAIQAVRDHLVNLLKLACMVNRYRNWAIASFIIKEAYDLLSRPKLFLSSKFILNPLTKHKVMLRAAARTFDLVNLIIMRAL